MLEWLRNYLMDHVPGARDVEDFEIQPRVRGDTVYADLETLRKSKVVREKVAAIEKQVREHGL